MAKEPGNPSDAAASAEITAVLNAVDIINHGDVSEMTDQPDQV